MFIINVNIDKLNFLLFNLQFYCKYSLNLLSNYIYYYLKKYLLLSEKTRNLNILNIPLIENFIYFKNLKIFILNKNERLLNLNIENLKIQINNINEIAKCSYIYCIRHNIISNNLIYHVLEKNLLFNVFC